MGFRRHRFNLAIENFLEEYYLVIGKVHIPLKVCCNVLVAILRHETPLTASLCNATRYSFALMMLPRYVKLLHILPCINHTDVSDLLLSKVESTKVKPLISRLEFFEFINVALKNSARMLQSPTVIFDGVLRSYAQMKS